MFKDERSQEPLGIGQGELDHAKKKRKKTTIGEEKRQGWRAQTFGIETFGLPQSLITRG